MTLSRARLQTPPKRGDFIKKSGVAASGRRGPPGGRERGSLVRSNDLGGLCRKARFRPPHYRRERCKRPCPVRRAGACLSLLPLLAGSQVGNGTARPGRFGETCPRSVTDNDARTCSLTTPTNDATNNPINAMQSRDESRSHALIAHSCACRDDDRKRCDVVRFHPRQRQVERRKRRASCVPLQSSKAQKSCLTKIFY